MRRFFTLIEMMLSLFFLTLLLSTLFVWYRHLSLQKGEINAYTQQVFVEKNCDQQLNNILPKAHLKPCFFTTKADQRCVRGESLVFCFDAGAQSEPALSGIVLGRLFLDDQTETLCLGIWPADKEQNPCVTRPLLEGVQAVSFSFYVPPDPFQQVVDPTQVGKPRPKTGWQQGWDEEFHAMPAMVKITLKRSDKRTITLLYDLPQSEWNHIVYAEGS